jgi:hypothetical protein
MSVPIIQVRQARRVSGVVWIVKAYGKLILEVPDALRAKLNLKGAQA